MKHHDNADEPEPNPLGRFIAAYYRYRSTGEYPKDYIEEPEQNTEKASREAEAVPEDRPEPDENRILDDLQSIREDVQEHDRDFDIDRDF